MTCVDALLPRCVFKWQSTISGSCTGFAASLADLLQLLQGCNHFGRLPGADAQLTADAASTRGMLQQMDKALKQAKQHSEECCRQAEMQKLALGSLTMLAPPGEV